MRERACHVTARRRGRPFFQLAGAHGAGPRRISSRSCPRRRTQARTGGEAWRRRRGITRSRLQKNNRFQRQNTSACASPLKICKRRTRHLPARRQNMSSKRSKDTPTPLRQCQMHDDYKKKRKEKNANATNTPTTANLGTRRPSRNTGISRGIRGCRRNRQANHAMRNIKKRQPPGTWEYARHPGTASGI